MHFLCTELTNSTVNESKLVDKKKKTKDECLANLAPSCFNSVALNRSVFKD